MAVSGVMAYEWAVTLLPLLARDAFGGDASVFDAMISVVGRLAIAGSIQLDVRWLCLGGRSEP